MYQNAEKRCSKCGVVKPLSMFKVDSRRNDGHASHCKECQRKDAKRFRDANPDKIASYQGRYEGRYVGRYKETHTRCINKWLEENQGARAAHRAVSSAIRKGILSELTDTPCARCGQPAKHYHHVNGYSPEHQLDVVPLCAKCHRQAHSR